MKTERLKARLELRGVKGDLLEQVLAVAAIVNKKGMTLREMTEAYSSKQRYELDGLAVSDVIHAVKILEQHNDVQMGNDGLYRRLED